ncbi:MAG TPA: hypothetical protein VLC71_07520 [Thermomonas sp.]|nr:hypothetical protein [Thermomonas sp.]
MSWDPFQRAVLAELGHAVYRPLPRSAAGAAQVDEAVLARLARAAAMDVEEFARRFDDLAALAALRGDARAKRALWPRLRAMRRSHA